MTIYNDINSLVLYALEHKLIGKEDYFYSINRLTNLLLLDSYIIDNNTYKSVSEPSCLIDQLLDYAFEHKIFSPNTISQRDLFESKIMDIFTPRPSTINYVFNKYRTDDSAKATDYFYHLSQKSNYIKTSRSSKNIKWKSNTPYGLMDMTINLSKPEKDPRDIIKQGKISSNSYPKCLLCREQVGFYGGNNKPGRSNHRIVHLDLNNEDFYLQYSPYVYYNEHSIVLKKEHEPMNVTIDTFKRLLDFVDLFPHYFLGSNAGLPIVGGSILSHEHYQGGRYKFPIEDAKVLSRHVVNDVTVKQLYWPLSVLRLESTNRDSIIVAADRLFKFWEQYSDESAGICAFSDEPHNAITPIARKQENNYILDIALRNNITNEEYPLGVFHPHQENHNIKKENIGLIEVMGLAVLPARLEVELEEIKKSIKENSSLPSSCSIHDEWVNYLKEIYNGENLNQFIDDQVAIKFVKCIEDSGVFKQTIEGREQFDIFTSELLKALNKEC